MNVSEGISPPSNAASDNSSSLWAPNEMLHAPCNALGSEEQSWNVYCTASAYIPYVPCVPYVTWGHDLACKFNTLISLSFFDTLRGVWGSQEQLHLMSVRHHVNGTVRTGTEIYHKWNRQFHSEPFSVKLLNPCIIWTFFVCVIIMTFSSHFLWGSNLRNSKHWYIETGSAK